MRAMLSVEAVTDIQQNGAVEKIARQLLEPGLRYRYRPV